ncbi:hypothetical protein ACTXT7_007804 [Hymenolepis weldensis]
MSVSLLPTFFLKRFVYASTTVDRKKTIDTLDDETQEEVNRTQVTASQRKLIMSPTSRLPILRRNISPYKDSKFNKLSTETPLFRQLSERNRYSARCPVTSLDTHTAASSSTTSSCSPISVNTGSGGMSTEGGEGGSRACSPQLIYRSAFDETEGSGAPMKPTLCVTPPASTVMTSTPTHIPAPSTIQHQPSTSSAVVGSPECSSSEHVRLRRRRRQSHSSNSSQSLADPYHLQPSSPTHGPTDM